MQLVFRMSTRYKPIDNHHAAYPEETKKISILEGKNRYAFDKNNGKPPGMLTVPRDLGIDLIYFSNETASFCVFLIFLCNVLKTSVSYEYPI